MINSNKIHFIAAPFAQHTQWYIDNVDKVFNFDANNKIFFRFGSKARIDIARAFPSYTRISLVANDHILNFRNINFVYYGWELVTCLDELYRDFPGSEFSIAMNKEEDLHLEYMPNTGKYNDLDKLHTIYAQHRKNIRNFLEGKNYTEKIREKTRADGSIKSVTFYRLTN